MATSTQWQLTGNAAERYEYVLVPSILGPSARALVEHAASRPGDTVLDVGCGTGAAARLAAERVGANGRVFGVDINDGMIEVARSLPPVAGAAIEWHVSSADKLPLEDSCADLALCAQALQFFPNRPATLTEVRRVLKPHGQLGLSLWTDLSASPYFHALVEALTKHIGPDTAAGLRAAFGLSDAASIRTLIEEAGFGDALMTEVTLELDLPPPEAFVPSHVGATPMASAFGSASPEARAAVVRYVIDALAPYQTHTGLRVPFNTYIVTARA